MGAGVMRMLFEENSGAIRDVKRSNMDWQSSAAHLDAMDSSDDQNALMGLFPELLHQAVQYLSPQDAHAVLVGPICRSFYKQATCNKLLWRAMCSNDPWQIPYAQLDDMCLCSIDVWSEAKEGGGSSSNSSRSENCAGGRGRRMLPPFRRPTTSASPPGSSRVAPLSFLSQRSRSRSRSESDDSSDPTAGRDGEGPAGMRMSPQRQGRGGNGGGSWDGEEDNENNNESEEVKERRRDSGGFMGLGFGLVGSGDQRGQQRRRRPPCCRAATCMARALRKQHSVLVQQVRRLRAPEENDEVKVGHVCEAMHQFPVVLGIQVECLEAIVPLLEREAVRKLAQESALGHAVVACLRNFASRIDLQHVALHCLVLLARPIGGREGAVHIGMAPALPALQGPRGGICAVMEIMDHHHSEGALQAMACWTLVNFALNADCKALLLGRGGLMRILSAMSLHPKNYAVQFRGLFALINLVVPDVPNQQPQNIAEVIECVLCAMEAFHEDTRLMNRGCLVLQNLSLNDMNHWSLRASRAKDVLAVALLRHGQRDSMLKLSAQATAERLFGPDHGMGVVPLLTQQQQHMQHMQQQPQIQYMQQPPQQQQNMQQPQQQPHMPPSTSSPFSSSASSTPPYSSSAVSSFLLGSSAGLAAEAPTSGNHQQQLAHASMLMAPGVPTSLAQHQQQFHHHLGASTPLSALDSIDLPESARNA